MFGEELSMNGARSDLSNNSREKWEKRKVFNLKREKQAGQK
jgi:hypothetical protein